MSSTTTKSKKSDVSGSLNYPRMVADIGGTNARFALEMAHQKLMRTQKMITLKTSKFRRRNFI